MGNNDNKFWGFVWVCIRISALCLLYILPVFFGEIISKRRDLYVG